MGLFSSRQPKPSGYGLMLPKKKTNFLDKAAPFLAIAAATADPENPLAGFALQTSLAKRQQRDIDEKEAQAAAMIRQTLAEEGFPDHVINGLMADPKKVAEILFDKYRTRQGGAEGITVGGISPTTGRLETQTSAGWHDNSYFGGSDGTEAPPIIREGLKFVPTPPGGMTQVFKGVSGAPVYEDEVSGLSPAGSDEASLRAEAARAIQNGADPAAVQRRLQQLLGGASQPGSRTFP